MLLEQKALVEEELKQTKPAVEVVEPGKVLTFAKTSIEQSQLLRKQKAAVDEAMKVLNPTPIEDTHSSPESY